MKSLAPVAKKSNGVVPSTARINTNINIICFLYQKRDDRQEIKRTP
jgi:hypothetical protein